MTESTNPTGGFAGFAALAKAKEGDAKTPTADAPFEPVTLTCLPVQNFGLGEHFVFEDGYLTFYDADRLAEFSALFETQPPYVKGMIKEVASREVISTFDSARFVRGADNSDNGSPTT